MINHRGKTYDILLIHRIRVLADHLGKVNDTVQWGTQFMRHIGEKFRLVLRGDHQLFGSIL
ncbi:hypothetical protein D3C75_1047940 [compost metagenome]